MKHPWSKLAVALAAAAVLSAPVLAEARPGGGGGGGGLGPIGGAGPGHGGGWSGNRGGNWHGGGYGGYRGGWGSRGYWGPGYFWGGVGLGLGLGAIAYGSPWYDGYGSYYGGYYPAGYARYEVAVPADGYYVYGAAAPGAEYVAVEPARDPRAARSGGQPVPAATRAPDPIFYPRTGQSAAQTETDRQDCNRWAATQPAALSDASVFQRAAFACMDGRGYTVR